MKYTNYIWDFDGTLFNSYPHLLECLWKVMKEEGLTDSFEKEDVNRHLLVSFGDMRTYTGLSDEAYRRFTAYQLRIGEDEMQPPVVPFDDCREVLAAIVQNGGKNYLYTHRNKTALWYFDKFDLRQYFTDFVTSEEGFPSKPAPNAVQSLVERNSLDPKICIMVGDREIDGLSGKNAGIAGALVGYPPFLPDGRSPADVTAMDCAAKTLTEFARMMGIL